MSRKFLTAISHAIWDSDLVGTRLILFFGELMWAIMLIWQGNTFDRPTYAYMERIATEEVWSLMFLVSSITQLTIVLTDDMHSRFARYFAGWNAVLWNFVVASMLLSVYPPPAAIGGEVALAIAAFWVWIRPYILSEGYKRAGYY